MDFPNQAPAGGAISNVNRQFYDGGQFMPVTGLACGLKKKAKKWADARRDYWAELRVDRGLVIARVAGTDRLIYLNQWKLNGPGEAEAFAAEVLRLRGEWYTARGLQPHPTQLVIV